MAHKYSQRVYFSDTDCQGIVYHGKYLDFAEHARSEMIRDTVDHAKLLSENVGIVVKEINIVYNTPAKFDDILDVYTSIVSKKLFSLTVKQEIKRDDLNICTLMVKVACINLETKKILKVTDIFE